MSYTSLLIVVAIAFGAPLLLGFFPGVRLPSAVLEIVAGIVAGPAVLGWAHVDEPVSVLSVLGLAFLLFLAGLEIEFSRLRGTVLRIAGLSFAASFAVALVAGVALKQAGLVNSSLFVAIVLSATSLGVVIPVLKDAGEAGSTFGQLVIAAASIADFATIILLSLLFSQEASSATSKLILIGALLVAVALVALAVAGVEHLAAVRRVLLRLQDTTAQIRIRGAMVLLVGFVALATQLGLEVILGAFLAGATLALVDRDTMMTHPEFRTKLEAAGFGIFVPIFFVTTGLRYDLSALGHISILVHVPLFLAALAAARGLPALLYRRLIGSRRTAAAALLQATSLPFIVASTAIGLELDVVSPGNAAALVAAGLVSVVLFPAAALSLLREPATTPAGP